MSNLTVRLPDSLHERLKMLAQAEGVSINQFMVLATAEKMSALETENFLALESKKGSANPDNSCKCQMWNLRIMTGYNKL